MRESDTQNIHEEISNGLVFGWHETLPLTEESRVALHAIMEGGQSCSLTPLGGRNGVSVSPVPGIGRVVTKQYSRGGLLRYVLSTRYVHLSSNRARHEFETLVLVREHGVNAPRPVAYAYRGGLLYEAWLCTQEIPETETIAALAVKDEDRVRTHFDGVVQQIYELIDLKLFHVDLHPGNVLLDRNNTAYLIDFDKAYSYTGTRAKLRDRYLCRWRRAVIKHALPEYLTELMSHGLRKNFEE